VCDVEPHRKLLFRCLTCGAPRIPAGDGRAPSGSEVEALVLARKEQLRMGALRAAAAFLLGSGALSAVVALLILAVVTAGLLAKSVALLAAGAPFVLAALAWRSAARHEQALEQSLDQAYLSVLAEENQRAVGKLDAATVARRFGVGEARAELWLAELSVQELMGEVVPTLNARLRVPNEVATGEPAAESLAKSPATSENRDPPRHR
jgi:hypothetical protein